MGAGCRTQDAGRWEEEKTLDSGRWTLGNTNKGPKPSAQSLEPRALILEPRA